MAKVWRVLGRTAAILAILVVLVWADFRFNRARVLIFVAANSYIFLSGLEDAVLWTLERTGLREVEYYTFTPGYERSGCHGDVVEDKCFSVLPALTAPTHMRRLINHLDETGQSFENDGRRVLLKVDLWRTGLVYHFEEVTFHSLDDAYDREKAIDEAVRRYVPFLYDPGRFILAAEPLFPQAFRDDLACVLSYYLVPFRRPRHIYVTKNVRDDPTLLNIYLARARDGERVEGLRAVDCTDYSYVAFDPAAPPEDGPVLGEGLHVAVDRNTFTAVLDHYWVPYEVYLGRLLLPRSVVEDPELIAHYVAKAQDRAWLKTTLRGLEAAGLRVAPSLTFRPGYVRGWLRGRWCHEEEAEDECFTVLPALTTPSNMRRVEAYLEEGGESFEKVDGRLLLTVDPWLQKISPWEIRVGRRFDDVTSRALREVYGEQRWVDGAVREYAPLVRDRPRSARDERPAFPRGFRDDLACVLSSYLVPFWRPRSVLVPKTVSDDPRLLEIYLARARDKEWVKRRRAVDCTDFSYVAFDPAAPPRPGSAPSEAPVMAVDRGTFTAVLDHYWVPYEESDGKLLIPRTVAEDPELVAHYMTEAHDWARLSTTRD